MADDRLSNSLTVLAETVRSANSAREQAELEAIEQAQEVGRLLCEAKDHCQHGQWLPFLERAGLSERKAQRWMKLHRGRLQSDTVSLLGGVTPARTFLSFRDHATGFLDEAERTAIHFDETGEGRENLQKPIECALSAIDAMMAMFPPYIVRDAQIAEIGERVDG